ncbi:uncharacterized protein LOC143195831 [Rhynchophorus ferrugineus]|uniref:Uncharacterized protein n=1 Tax=Rhynchophorus ferrugineus TaxID=354439 RepID=A0A834IIK8_RHYFE|nr:hypothetical protein GWI33_008249 [Rhynchophorus ferrugineus]
MNKNVIDLVKRGAIKDDSSKEEKLQQLVFEALKKFDLNLDQNSDELKFLNFDVSRYQQSHTKSVFGEKQSLSYMFHFTTYNLEYIVKLLAFQYDNKMETLKLDIEPLNIDTKKELEYCCNYLKRRRNLNQMFITIIQFSRFIEARRLICDVILKKCNKVTISSNKDGGIIIVYSNELMQIKFGIMWSIIYNSVQEITDVVEVYYKNVECPNKDSIKHKLIKITHPNLNFTTKYHLWKELFRDLEKDTRQKEIPSTYSPAPSGSLNVEIMDTSEATGIVLVSDSEDSGFSLGKSAHNSSARTNLHHIPSLITSTIQTLCSVNNNENIGKQFSNRLSDNIDCDIPNKKSKKDTVDDDLEITSITYVVPD